MSKLSRKDKYRDLRESIEEQAEKTQTPGRPSRLSRMAAPDAKAESRKEIAPEPNPVIEDLLGEVRQYNINKGELVEEDTQLQILHDLSAKEQADARRSEHFEVMEPNDDAGGTTRNLFGSDLSSVLAASARTQPAASGALRPEEPAKTGAVLPAQEEEDQDDLDLFTPGSRPAAAAVEETEETADVAPQKTARAKTSFFGRSKKTASTAAKRSSQEDTDQDTLDSLFETSEIFTPDLSDQDLLESVEDQDDDQDYFDEKPVRFLRKSARAAKEDSEQGEQGEQTPPASRAAMIFMVICCIVLVILIILTIYWMSKLGIF